MRRRRTILKATQTGSRALPLNLQNKAREVSISRVNVFRATVLIVGNVILQMQHKLDTNLSW